MLKNYSKIVIVGILSLVLFLSPQMGFADEASLDDIGDKLKALGLLIGDENGNMHFENNITRAEFAVIAARLIGKEEESLTKKGETKFSDVPNGHWASGHINVTVENAIFAGYDDGTFKLNNKITYGEIFTVIINALGYGDEVPPENWPENFVTKAEELGLTASLSFDSKDAASRGDVAKILDNALSLIVKN